MTTAVQVQYRRGTASQVASFTGAAGEMVVDTTNNRVVVQDGATAGGFPAAKLAEVQTNTRTQVSDANYTALTSDRTIAYVALTAARTVSLPAASAFPGGSRLLVVDESGACSSTSTITLAAAGSDTIDGAASVAIKSAYGYLAIESNTANKWTVIDQAAPLNGLSGPLTIAASDGASISASGSTITIGGPGGMVNKFRNATMDVWQRGTAPALTAGTSGWQYTADGWIVNWAASSAAAPSISQAGGRLLTKSSLQVTGATNITDLSIRQRIESYIAAALCSQIVTVQAWVYNATGGAITPTLTVNRPIAQDNYASIATDVNAVSLQPCANGAWTRVAYTFAANAAAYNGLEVVLDFGNNFGSAGKSVQLAECDIRVTPGAATGLNVNPPPPELRLIASELALCQRYFASNFGNGVAPANASLQTNYTGFATATTNVQINGIVFPTQMAAAPTVTFYSSPVGTPSNGEWSYFLSGSWVAGSATVVGGLGATRLGCNVNVTASGLTSGQAYAVAGMWTASAEL